MQWLAVVCGCLPASSLVTLPIVQNAGDLWWFAVVCGGLWWFVVVCGGLRWFAGVCLLVMPSEIAFFGVSLISKSPRIAANRSRLNSGANNPLRPSVAVCITSFK